MQVIGNGAILENYSWTQTYADVTITIKLPLGTKSKSIIVNINNKTLQAGLIGEPLIIDGELHKRIIVDDSLWNLEDNRDLCIILRKERKSEWWKGVIRGDPEIDISKISSDEIPFSELDLESRQSAEKLRFDARQKAKGLPISEEIEQQDALKRILGDNPGAKVLNISPDNVDGIEELKKKSKMKPR